MSVPFRERNPVVIGAVSIAVLILGLLALLGYMAIAAGVQPLNGDNNTVVPVLFDQMFPDWLAGLAYAAIGIGALVPAAILIDLPLSPARRLIRQLRARPGLQIAQDQGQQAGLATTIRAHDAHLLATVNRERGVGNQQARAPPEGEGGEGKHERESQLSPGGAESYPDSAPATRRTGSPSSGSSPTAPTSMVRASPAPGWTSCIPRGSSTPSSTAS